ncbi:hypothetical protein EW093_12290 [Thiospirochaeta perfilievii]|uniref:Mannosyl-glycoprotein endo-beta-N-acetylglucosamidase-like domain-containing protein n=1 Tax=Thiospirochaeta perfilievii TaxID=252967 RepID=A0A5C1QEM7_9SPIO|nr:glucosaminidase domain-containing protein [Thiospirochaeta perfilievii]QEN05459.1 hypothetical protein EW093_12290 [Thiospirochaeta perfilievii]
MIRKLVILHTLLLLVSTIYGVNDKIYSQGSSSVDTLAQFLSQGNGALGEELVYEFATIYIEESKIEGINWDIAFVQMCLETGFLRYGGLVESGQNNFCGLGSFDNKQGASFPTIREGVRAHIQHLKAYSSTEDLNRELLDPRFHFVERGSALDVHDLTGRWATDPKYGIKLVSLLQRVSLIERTQLVLNAEVPMGYQEVSEPKVMVVSDIIEVKPVIKDVVETVFEGIIDENIVEDGIEEKGGWLK